ncbi:glutamate racemase [Diplocloster modestus]|uniref:Glutamate racemase n=1 Tax=Diplocloster modestus TaxID=2850322 RepID=A0ABS6K4G6_9FIRM|nr:glutamate racemase [Diplocloster modestus]MBU9725395.1 glutamate racemase [Diplocloster modestus]
MKDIDIHQAPIGVFDSGVGGLTVVREIMRQIPQERIVYFGDTARVPYGNKSKDNIIRYSRQIIRFLRTQKVKAIVVACNTASACALEEIRPELDLPIIGVIKPGAKVAANTTRNGRIGVIGTESTVKSQMYTDFIHDLNPDIQVIGKACPLFVPLVEEGWLKDPVTEEVAGRYLEDMKHADVDTLILGCTHYPLLRSTVGKVMGGRVTLVNPAYETALELKELLRREGIAAVGTSGSAEEVWPEHRFFVSDLADKFKDFANSILACEISQIRQIPIENY